MLKLGVIGLSEGNGHPYSWSAIINGDFDRAEMAQCGYPVIPVYLEANRDTLGIENARVTHIWTQDRAISEHIAKASRIESVVDKAAELIGRVDAVLLARDDPENHVPMANPFLDAGIPIFIDKPLAIHSDDLAYFAGQHAAGNLIMSCSSMRYAVECQKAKKELKSLGKIELATVTGAKSWIKYGVHMLEALYSLLDDPVANSVQHVSEPGRDIVLINFQNSLLATVHIFMEIAPAFHLSLFGRNGWRWIEIKDYYAMFRENLKEFVHSVREGRSRLAFEKTDNIIRTLIGAVESLEQGGKKVILN